MIVILLETAIKRNVKIREIPKLGKKNIKISKLTIAAKGENFLTRIWKSKRVCIR